MSNTADLRNIPVSQIQANPVALRAVNTESEKFIQLRDSIRDKGILNPISVREKQAADGTPYYEVIDGLHRFTGATEAGLENIPALVKNLDDGAVLEAQIVGNLARVDTKPVEYTKQLQRILSLNPTMTVADLAARVHESPAWINQRMGLLKLSDQIQELVDDGKINVTNAINLSKLPSDEQLAFLEQALTMSPAEFAPTVTERKKALDAARREGRAATEATFEPVPHLRKVTEFKSELENPKVGPAIVAALGLKTAAEGFAAAIKFALSLDADSVAAGQKKFDERAAKAAAEKQARALERAEKKQKEADALVAAAKAAAGA